MNIPEQLKYTKEHEWIKVEDNIGIIGITDYAQSELGDIVYVDISSELTEIVKGKSFGTIEAVKTVSELYAPCSGKVIEVNSKLNDEPQLINTDPYGEGWIIKIQLKDNSELNDLLDAKSYGEQIGQ
ncbi:glycine cleavage system protein GcvH [Melioribacteraceae bacterium 4301-Me]|uniref:glycine cleavage system protein GcvH n=1 Tax=Pyranulibacter aquaticus TaxID=3163344 RepID=UPI00359AB299